VTDTREPISSLANRLTGCPTTGSRWRHFKGGLYEIVGAAILEATREPLVLYRPAGENLVFARPLGNWNDTVDHDGRPTPRFSAEEG
jgi:hypothetical protein